MTRSNDTRGKDSEVALTGSLLSAGHLSGLSLMDLVVLEMER